MTKTTPLIFGVRFAANGSGPYQVTYLQAQGDGTYSPVFPFGDLSVDSTFDATFRTGRDLDGKNVQWIGIMLLLLELFPLNDTFPDLFVVDMNKNLWHTRNKAYDTGRTTAVKRRLNGDIFVPEWETPSIIISKRASSFKLANDVDGSGHAYLVMVPYRTENNIPLEIYVQDMSSTNWTKMPVFSIDHTASKILKRNVFYVELAVRKDGVPTQGDFVPSTSISND
jgi:hypothetical protein